LQVRCGSNTGKRSTSLRIDFDVEIEANSDVKGDMFKNLTFQQYSILQRMKMDIIYDVIKRNIIALLRK
jgi:hypothetical protein